MLGSLALLATAVYLARRDIETTKDVIVAGTAGWAASLRHSVADLAAEGVHLDHALGLGGRGPGLGAAAAAP